MRHMSAPGFNYSLQALLRMRDAELSGARDALTGARRQVEEHARRLREQLDGVILLEQQVRKLIAPGASIDPEAAQRVQRYLALEQIEARKRQVETDEARQSETQALGRWRAAHQAVRILERHRESMAATFEIEQTRREQRSVDELYLLSRSHIRDGAIMESDK